MIPKMGKIYNFRKGFGNECICILSSILSSVCDVCKNLKTKYEKYVEKYEFSMEMKTAF